MRILCLALLLIGGQALAENDPLAGLKKGQPKDVTVMIDRYAGCNHWSEEEPYDAERKKEIAAALKELRCSKLDVDEKRILRKYANNPSALKALKMAKETAF